MSWFDRFRRKPPPPKRRLYVQQRGFDAARTEELLSGFAATSYSADQELLVSLERMRGRCRNLATNNDFAKRFVSMTSQNVAGPSGFTLQVHATEPDGRLDTIANERIEAAFRDWGRRGTCEVSGSLSWGDVQRLICETWARDGEVLIRKVRGAAARNPYRFALQILDIDRLPVGKCEQAKNGNTIVMGVELNAVGRPVAYHINRRHPGANAGMLPGDTERVDASEILHIFRPQRPEQHRGAPPMHSAAIRLEMLGKFETAAVTAARKGAETLGFFVTPDGQPLVADDTTADGNQVLTSSPGTYDTLPAGYDFRAHDTDYPNALFGEFVKGCLRGIASGLDVSYNTLANDLEGVNYSSIRAGLLEERAAWMGLQEWLIEAFLRPVFLEWLDLALLAGAIRFPAGAALPAVKYDKFAEHTWQGRRWPWVDPLKDIEAQIRAIDAGLKSRRQVVAEMGADLGDVWSQLQAENALAAQMGLSVAAPAAPVAAPPPPNAPPDDDEMDSATLQ